MLDKVIEIGILFDFYGSLLTEKQQEAIQLYYYQDLSLINSRKTGDTDRVSMIIYIGRRSLKDYEVNWA